MSIASIIQTARSGLMATQTSMSVVSTNITNADTVGYTTKSAQTATRVTSGQGTGVSVVGIGNTIDDALAAKVRDATASAAYDETTATYLATVLSAWGSTEDGAALEDAMTSLLDTLSGAITAGGDADATSDVLDALETWTTTLRDASNAITSARTAADEAISDAVEEVNGLLKDLDALNDQIVQATAKGLSTADLLDTQRQKLSSLSELVDVTTFTTSTGEVRVYASGGQPLLTGDAATLSYTPGGSPTAITINGADATSKLKGGSLGALIETRDETLPALQESLDGLATDIQDAINAASSRASVVPAPTTLTSNETVDPTASFTGTGTLTVMTVDRDGVVVTSETLDLSSLTTTADLISALDGLSGISATLNSDGTLSLAAEDGTSGVVLSGDGTRVTTSDGEREFAHALGFNTLLTGTGAAAMSVSTSATSQGIPLTVADATASVGETALVDGDTSGLQGVWAALDDPIAFDAAGTLPAASKTAVARIASLLDDLADTTEAAQDAADLSGATRDALTESFDNAHGVNVDEESAKLVALEQSYQAISQIMSTAQTMFDSLISMMK